MTYCFNPDCPSPKNPETHRFCQACGWRLRLGDRYEAVQPLGTGQHSRTFLGRDRSTLIKPQCLIKRFTPAGNTGLARDTAAERLRKDVVHLAIASQHPQIPNLLSYWERGQHQFLVQAFLVGMHLDQCLQAQRGPFTSAAVLDLLRDVLPILQHLHQHHIIHRDIKPTNLRRPADQSHWWLVDLGVFKPLTATRIATPGTVVGSAEYVAPEQLRGEATFASDLYSLGVVCLHLLTGLRPFDLFDGVYGCWRWRSIVPDVSDQLATVLDHMVQPRLGDRIASVEAVMTALQIPHPEAPDLPPVTPRRAQPWTANWEVHLETEIDQIVALPQADVLLVLTAVGSIEVRSLHRPQMLLDTLVSSNLSPSVLAPHPQQPAFALGTRQGELKIWHLTQGQWHCHTLTALSHGITQLIFTPNGQAIMGADNQGGLHQWQSDGDHKTDWPGGHSTGITALALSHSGTLLASGDTQGQVKLWQVSTMECLRTFSRHAGAITTLGWLANDQALVSVGWDMTIWWRCPATGGILQAVNAQGFSLPIRSLLTDRTRPYLITGSQDGQLQCWPTPPATPGGLAKVHAIATAPSSAAPIMGLTQQAPTIQISTFLCATQAGYLIQRSFPHIPDSSSK